MSLTSTITHSLHSRRSIALLLAACAASACATSRSHVDVEASISDSLALSGAVVFHAEGGPIDALDAEPDALSVPEAVRRAVETSPELQAALARVRVAEADADLAGSLPNPVLDLVVRFREGGGTPDIESSLSADLLSILQRKERSSAAVHRLETAASTALASALAIVAETRTLYANAQALDAQLPLLAERAVVLDRLRAVQEARLALGESARSEVTALDVERMQLDVETARRRSELRVARLALAQRIGEPSGAALWKLDPWESPASVPTDEQAWITAALGARPEVRAIVAEIRALGDEAELSGAGSLDGLAAGVDAERSDGEDSIGPTVTVPIPIFDTGRARKDRAHARASEARHRLTEARRAVVSEVRTALASLSDAQASHARVAGELIPLLERRRAEAEAALSAGFADATAPLLAEQALQASRSQVVALEREVTAAHLALERAVGGTAAFRTVVAAEGSRP